ncbi:hypothetical protein OHT52_21930 [Streptomyces sp. NBC_00247]|uniref:hypothetical protein n=1 Tax=Streptomyces sp. NBC_00247 TaxID=2975689 RepID=UPI002E2E633D|nr:hypothetical protein [Streptomyces sp. NBC_00247]
MTTELPPQPTEAPALAPEDPTPADAPARRQRPVAALLAGLVIGAGTVGGAWAISANSGPGEPGTFTLEGSFVLTDSVVPDGNGGCGGTRGYDDISEGVSVTVYSAKGDVVATGGLGASTYDQDTYVCRFGVSVPDVPRGEKFYKVEISHRGTLQLSADEAEAGKFAGSLG